MHVWVRVYQDGNYNIAIYKVIVTQLLPDQDITYAANNVAKSCSKPTKKHRVHSCEVYLSILRKELSSMDSFTVKMISVTVWDFSNCVEFPDADWGSIRMAEINFCVCILIWWDNHKLEEQKANLCCIINHCSWIYCPIKCCSRILMAVATSGRYEERRSQVYDII